MAKSNRKNRTKDRSDPIAKPAKPPTDPELAAIREKQILPIINDLTSPDTKKRAAAAIAIANLIEDTRCRKLLLREQVVKILLEQTTTDSALESKCAGWGILRNLALEEEADFCIHLFRQDILTAISGIVSTLVETVQSEEHPISNLSKAQRDLVWSLSGSVVNLISSLAEAQEEIVEAISNISIITNFLFTLLSYNGVPEQLFLDILACLASLAEDNAKIAQAIVDNDSWLKGLMSLQKSGGPRAVSACGVLHNVYTTMRWFDHNTPIIGASDATIVSSLMESIIQGFGNSSGGDRMPEQVLQLALEITASIATTLQEALEHASRNEKEFEGFGDEQNGEDSMMIADNGADADDDDIEGDGGNDEDEFEDEEEDEMTQEEIEADMARVTGADDDDEEISDDQPTLVALVRVATPTILKLAQSSSNSSEEQNAVRDSALSALNNISWTMSSIDFASSGAALLKSWSGIAQRVWDEIVSPVLASNTADIELASAITSLAWALARSVHGQITIQSEEQRKFMALYQASKSLNVNDEKSTAGNAVDAFQGLGVKCIGVLGQLALSPAPVALNREIGIFLLTTLAALPETPEADAVEAMNAVFDIYADEDFECDAKVFVKDGFLKHLDTIVPKARAMAKKIDKRKKTELRARADEAVLNLDRFVKYKRSVARR